MPAMGMYDSLYFIGKAAEMVKCAAGHPQTGELQTKDFDCELTIYYVHVTDAGHMLFLGRATAQRTESFVDGEGLLQQTVRSTYSRFPTNASLAAYGTCLECDPIVYERGEGAMFGGRVGEERVWCEWELRFEKGLLVAVEPRRVESREEVRARVMKLEPVVVVLPDDDRVARRHIEKTRQQRGSSPF